MAFSFIGYVTKEVPVKRQKTLNISLAEEILNLEEVVVVGYGVQKKRDLTGAVTQVKATSLEKERPATVQDILRANVAGLNIGLDNSAKGGGSMEIRGKRSIKASNEPLLVVDGIIYYGSLDEINPNDIAQIDVLKDASSAAVYGAKSAAGVVLITTKKDRLKNLPSNSMPASALHPGEEEWMFTTTGIPCMARRCAGKYLRRS